MGWLVFSVFPKKNQPKLEDVFELPSWPWLIADLGIIALRRCHDLVGSSWRIHEASLGFLSASLQFNGAVFGGKKQLAFSTLLD